MSFGGGFGTLTDRDVGEGAYHGRTRGGPETSSETLERPQETSID